MRHPFRKKKKKLLPFLLFFFFSGHASGREQRTLHRRSGQRSVLHQYLQIHASTAHSERTRAVLSVAVVVAMSFLLCHVAAGASRPQSGRSTSPTAQRRQAWLSCCLLACVSCRSVSPSPLSLLSGPSIFFCVRHPVGCRICVNQTVHRVWFFDSVRRCCSSGP